MVCSIYNSQSGLNILEPEPVVIVFPGTIYPSLGISRAWVAYRVHVLYTNSHNMCIVEGTQPKRKVVFLCQ